MTITEFTKALEAKATEKGLEKCRNDRSWKRI